MKTKPSQSSLAEMNSVLVRTSSLCNLLVKDANRALKDSKEEGDELRPYRRRIFIRTLFAMVEGFCFCYRNLMLNCAALSDYKFSAQEILKLKELREVTDRSSGESKQIQAWLDIEENLKISFEWIAKFICIEFKLDTDSDGYQALLETKKIRNDLMHPKKTSCLVIGDSQFQRAEKALEWFLDEIARLNEKMSEIRSGDLVKKFVKSSARHA